MTLEPYSIFVLPQDTLQLVLQQMFRTSYRHTTNRSKRLMWACRVVLPFPGPSCGHDIPTGVSYNTYMPRLLGVPLSSRLVSDFSLVQTRNVVTKFDFTPTSL